ncbi:MAG TPA: substrate-binding domain-containing protein [Bryobacteraceae bacterium]|nr:substrate-binding domain-containing protein [Bryobacteraceae bacterium]
MRAARIVPLTLIAVMAIAPVSSHAQITVLTSGGFSAAYQRLVPAFEKRTGIAITTLGGASQGSAPNTIPSQLRRGVAADVVILSKEGLGDLVADGRILAGSAMDLAQTPIGVAVRSGAPRPDIRTVEGFKQMLVRAQSIELVSTSGIYFKEKVFPELGIPQISAKVKPLSISDLTDGKVEIAIRPISELVNVPGVDLVGPIPREIQNVMVFSAAIVTGSKQTDAAQRLIAFLASEDAKPAILQSGMEPVAR